MILTSYCTYMHQSNAKVYFSIVDHNAIEKRFRWFLFENGKDQLQRALIFSYFQGLGCGYHTLDCYDTFSSTNITQ